MRGFAAVFLLLAKYLLFLAGSSSETISASEAEEEGGELRSEEDGAEGEGGVGSWRADVLAERVARATAAWKRVEAIVMEGLVEMNGNWGGS